MKGVRGYYGPIKYYRFGTTEVTVFTGYGKNSIVGL